MRKLSIAFIAIILLPGIALSEESLLTAEAKKEVTLSGYTRSHKAMQVYSEVPGKTLKVNYDIGDTAGKRPFIEIDTTFVDFEIESTGKAAGRLEVALERANSRVEYLEKEFWRVDTLHKGDMATEQRRDAAAQELEQARLERDSMGLELEGLRTRLSELAERRDRHNIFIPAEWVLTGRAVEAGEVVQPGVPLGTASDFRRLVVPLSVSEDELDAMRAMPREFDASVEGAPAKAKINWVNPEFDEATRKRSIELVITKYEGPRAGGLRVAFQVSVRTEGILVPREAITERYKNPRVMLKATGEAVPIIVIGESGSSVIAAEDPRLGPGTELLIPVQPR
jgi:hypothetical protein